LLICSKDVYLLIFSLKFDTLRGRVNEVMSHLATIVEISELVDPVSGRGVEIERIQQFDDTFGEAPSQVLYQLTRSENCNPKQYVHCRLLLSV
jgi:hypothetical protein